MNILSTQPDRTLRVVNAVSALGVAVGIVVQISTGVDGYPTPPPGAILAVVAAGVVTAVPWRYVGFVGLAYPVWIAIGAVVTSGTGDRLSEPSATGPFLGTFVQVVAIAGGLVSGAVLAVRSIRSRQTV